MSPIIPPPQIPPRTKPCEEAAWSHFTRDRAPRGRGSCSGPPAGPSPTSPQNTDVVPEGQGSQLVPAHLVDQPSLGSPPLEPLWWLVPCEQPAELGSGSGHLRRSWEPTGNWGPCGQWPSVPCPRSVPTGTPRVRRRCQPEGWFHKLASRVLIPGPPPQGQGGRQHQTCSGFDL